MDPKVEFGAVLVSSSKIDNVFYSLLLHLVAYFLTTLLCHSELARDRPSTAYLTNFYLWMSLGGMVGGIFNALFAPIVFPQAWEYPIAIAIGCMLIPKLEEEAQPPSPEKEGARRLFDFVIPAAMFLFVALLTMLPQYTWFGSACPWSGHQS